MVTNLASRAPSENASLMQDVDMVDADTQDITPQARIETTTTTELNSDPAPSMEVQATSEPLRDISMKDTRLDDNTKNSDSHTTLPPRTGPPSSNKKDTSNASTSARERRRTKPPTKSQKLFPGRIVRQTLAARPQGDIRTFKNSKELFHAASGAFEGLCALKDHADILHGSISPHNIMINKDGSGTLIDWDMPGVEVFNRTSKPNED